MGATKLMQIDSYKPCLTDKDIERVHKSIMGEIDTYNQEGNVLFEFECANGIKIDVEVEYSGFSYRRIKLNHTYVMYKVDDQYTSIEEYKNLLNSLITDSLYNLNSKEEEEYELQEQLS